MSRQAESLRPARPTGGGLRRGRPAPGIRNPNRLRARAAGRRETGVQGPAPRSFPISRIACRSSCLRLGVPGSGTRRRDLELVVWERACPAFALRSDLGREGRERVAAAAARELTARGNLHTRLYTTKAECPLSPLRPQLGRNPASEFPDMSLHYPTTARTISRRTLERGGGETGIRTLETFYCLRN